MDKVVAWPLWSAEEIVDALPGLVAVVEIHLQDLPLEHLEKNRAADWDRDFFEGDQKAVRSARFSTDIAGREKANASDHLLREKIHLVLREHPEIPVYVIRIRIEWLEDLVFGEVAGGDAR